MWSLKGQIETIAAHDCVGVAELAVSAPMPGKAFTVEVAGMVRQGTFAPEPQTGFSFLFGSCNQPFKREGDRAVPSETGEIYGPMLDVVRRSGTSFSLLVGDQAYADGIPGLSVPEWAREQPGLAMSGLLTLYRQVYRAYFGHPGFHALLEAHAFVLDLGRSRDLRLLGLEREHRAHRPAAVRKRAQGLPGVPAPTQPGRHTGRTGPLHYEFWYGCAGFFVFDLRRNATTTAGSLIGEAQWASFGSFLEGSQASEVQTVFIVVTTIPVIHFPPTWRPPAGLAAGTQGVTDAGALGLRGLPTVSRASAKRRCSPGRVGARPQGHPSVWRRSCGRDFRVHRKAGEGVLTQWTSSALSTPGGFDHTGCESRRLAPG